MPDQMWCGVCGEPVRRLEPTRRWPEGRLVHEEYRVTHEIELVSEEPPQSLRDASRLQYAIDVAFLMYRAKAREQEPWIEGNYGGPRYPDWQEKHRAELAKLQQDVEAAVLQRALAEVQRLPPGALAADALLLLVQHLATIREAA